MTIVGVVLLVAGAAAAIVSLIAPGPFVGAIAGPMLVAGGVALIDGASRAKARAARQRASRRGGYVI